jgi:TRAP-type C4-dicarboxylate transport system substrate-binding protein
MKTKTWGCALIAAALLVFSSLPTMAAEINIDVNCTMKPGGAEEAAIKKFKEVIEAKSKGRMQIKEFMSGQLGGEEAVLELLKIGQTQMALTGGIFRSMFAKEYDPISIPFYLPTWKACAAYFEGPLGQKIKELAAKNGGIIDFGPQKRAAREMTSNRKIENVEDLKGLKMRVPSVAIWVDVWKELGTLPTIIPAPEIYLAMKTGQVEAHENTLVGPYSRKMWEVQKYIIMTDHVFFPWHWVASKVWFEKLSASDQLIIRQAVAEAIVAGEKAEDDLDKFYADELKKNGMEFITPDLAGFRQKAKPAIDRALKDLAPEVDAEVKRVSAAQ